MHIDPFLAPFAGHNIAVVASVARQMLRLGIGPEEALERCAGHLERLKVSVGAAQPPSLPELAAPSGISCPECGLPVQITPVNISKCTNVGGGWKTSVICSNPRCRYTELSTKTVSEWRK